MNKWYILGLEHQRTFFWLRTHGSQANQGARCQRIADCPCPRYVLPYAMLLCKCKTAETLTKAAEPLRAPPASLFATMKLMLLPFLCLADPTFTPQIYLPFPHPCIQTTCAPPPPAWSLTLGYVQFLGVVAVGCCEMSIKKKKGVGGGGGGGAIGGGVEECLQTLGASPSPCQTRVTAGFC